jgi:dethiobiotin synthetase
MKKGFFITATDTGVGKTVISSALILLIKSLGFSVCGMKPIETGCIKQENNDSLLPADGLFLKNISEVNESLDLITPIRFENPLAPYTASLLEDKTIELEVIQKAFIKLSNKYNIIIVEGIGGLLVPIKKDYFVLDLALELALPTIIVTRPGLGTINHTLLTLKHSLNEGLEVAGIIINYSAPPTHSIAEKTNQNILEQICPLPIIGPFPNLKDLEKETIEEASKKCIQLKHIKKYL